MIAEESEQLAGDGDVGVIPEVKERARWLEVRRRIEDRQELKRLRELLDDPDFDGVE